MSEMISIFTVRHLLNTKKFIKKSKNSADGNDNADGNDADDDDDDIMLNNIKCEM
jgi:hypothetical protein